jgi:hypothetical protein
MEYGLKKEPLGNRIKNKAISAFDYVVGTIPFVSIPGVFLSAVHKGGNFLEYLEHKSKFESYIKDLKAKNKFERKFLRANDVTSIDAIEEQNEKAGNYLASYVVGDWGTGILDIGVGLITYDDGSAKVTLPLEVIDGLKSYTLEFPKVMTAGLLMTFLLRVGLYRKTGKEIKKFNKMVDDFIPNDYECVYGDENLPEGEVRIIAKRRD